MRILVTGEGGFLGAHVASRLASRGHEVIASRRGVIDARPVQHGAYRIVQCDLAEDSLRDIVAGCQAVVHCAARASPWGPRAVFWRDNVHATERLLDAARATGSVRRFVFMSSPGIYFRPEDQWDIGEDFQPPQAWPNHYAETKWAAETAVRGFAELGPVILRPRAVFGPGDRAIVPRILAVARRGFFPLPRGGSTTTEVTFVENVLDAVDLALDADSSLEGRAFNITNGEPVTVRELLCALFEALRLRVRLVPLPRALLMNAAALSETVSGLRPSRPEPRLTKYGIGLLAFSQTFSIAAARRDLGYQPRVAISEGLRRYARWMGAQ